MRRFLLGCFFAVILTGSALAALYFPTLTGRVVDEAGVISAPVRQNLEQMLADFERQSTDQVVVVTLRSLEGVSIEDYGYQLGRSWGIGQKDKNNGALLIVAPKERKVRIEVGYGLEGTLTDAAVSRIVQGIILPEFREGHMELGIVDGATAIVEALGGTALPATYVNRPSFNSAPNSPLANFLIFVVIFVFIMFRLFFPIIGLFGAFGTGTRGGGVSGGFGGGFSGGGGGFGGGGASGGW